MDNRNDMRDSVLTKDQLNSRLLEATMNGDAATVSALIADGADVNAVDLVGYTALMKAATKGDPATVSALIANLNINVEAKTNVDFTALMEAANKGHTAIVSALIAAGANVNAKTKNGTSVLGWAVMGEHTATAFIILDAMKPEEVLNLQSSKDTHIAKTVEKYYFEKSKLEAIHTLVTLSDKQNTLLPEDLCNNIIIPYLSSEPVKHIRAKAEELIFSKNISSTGERLNALTLSTTQPEAEENHSPSSNKAQREKPHP